MNRYLSPVILGLALATSAWQGAIAAANVERGKALYENHCRECHESQVHIRNKTKVRTLEDLRMQVARWSTEVGQGWSGEEVEDVMRYLSERYYQFPRR